MAAYHVVLVHFPIALWLASALLIFLRVVNDGPVGQAADRALPVFLVLGFVLGAVAWLIGTQVWDWPALSGTPMGRNHMLTATWSLAYFTLLMITRLMQGDALWHGMARWVMLVLSGVGVVLVGVTGTLGGHLVGNYTQVGEVLRLLGWEIYTTYYVPNITVALLIGLGLVMAVLGVLARRPASN
ncbi:MAG: heme ABC transporter permease [Rhodobacteraceae bacterium CG17_big_fil_post_rev_8_21_14_2_50_65_11]|nr:MAG: heme ABC transporter permease [Rhodobacteraceae bacterium CG17_big_fil_post_rev_8_21_14_2_50_65_11]